LISRVHVRGLALRRDRWFGETMRLRSLPDLAPRARSREYKEIHSEEWREDEPKFRQLEPHSELVAPVGGHPLPAWSRTLGGTGLLAALPPAWDASRVDPSVALRSD